MLVGRNDEIDRAKLDFGPFGPKPATSLRQLNDYDELVVLAVLLIQRLTPPVVAWLSPHLLPARSGWTEFRSFPNKVVPKESPLADASANFLYTFPRQFGERDTLEVGVGQFGVRPFIKLFLSPIDLPRS